MIENALYDLNAEFGVLGSILINPSLMSAVDQKITSATFIEPRNKVIFEKINYLYEKKQKIDIITLVDSIKTDKEEFKNYIIEILNATPTSANIDSYVEIILKYEKSRKAVEFANEIIDSVQKGENIDEINESIINNIKEVYSKKKGSQTLKSILPEFYNELDSLAINGENSVIKTGFYDVDKLLSGLQNENLIIVAGRPAMGKTSFATNIGINICKKYEKKVAIFSLEMSSLEITKKIISSEALIELSKLNNGELEDNDWVKIVDVARNNFIENVIINDKSNIKVAEIQKECEDIENLGLVIIDYLQLMQGNKNSQNRNAEISEITRSLKIMARELKVPVICLSQLSRTVEHRNNKRPMMSDLRDSGSIESDADKVIFVYRDEYYEPLTEDKNIAEIIIGKNRQGETGTAKLGWVGQYTSFVSLETRY